MATQNESPLNDPRHPCQFCAKPVPLAQDYCNQTCRTSDETLKVALSTSEVFCWESCFNPND